MGERVFFLLLLPCCWWDNWGPCLTRAPLFGPLWEGRRECVKPWEECVLTFSKKKYTNIFFSKTVFQIVSCFDKYVCYVFMTLSFAMVRDMTCQKLICTAYFTNPDLRDLAISTQKEWFSLSWYNAHSSDIREEALNVIFRTILNSPNVPFQNSEFTFCENMWRLRESRNFKCCDGNSDSKYVKFLQEGVKSQPMTILFKDTGYPRFAVPSIEAQTFSK